MKNIGKITLLTILLMGSTLIVVQSLLNCLVQLFVYPWSVSTLNLPIPHLAIGGAFVMFIMIVFIHNFSLFYLL